MQNTLCEQQWFTLQKVLTEHEAIGCPIFDRFGLIPKFTDSWPISHVCNMFQRQAVNLR